MGDPVIPRAEQLAGDVPEAVGAILGALSEQGHAAFLVGRCVRQLISEAEVRDFDVSTSAGPADVLALFGSAVATHLDRGTVTVPTAAGPVDVTGFRFGAQIADELAHRDFTIHALALDPLRGELIDPSGGGADLARGSLRAVGDAGERFAEDPLRLLRAARLVAELGLSPDAELESAMAAAAERLDGVAAFRIRAELQALLIAPGARAGLALLRRTGVEAVLAPGAPADAGEVVERLPSDVDLRLAAWLRGTRALGILRHLRHPRPRVRRIERILLLHPIDAQAPVAREVRMRRLLRRAGPHLSSLVTLREAEIAAAGGPDEEVERLRAFRSAVERIRHARRIAAQSARLALDGGDVMEHLGCAPGPAVGRALRHLAKSVAEDPELNTPEGLRTLLDAWHDEPGARGSEVT